ncbi:MAG TPA: ATP-binding protein [Egibacteraceae bacterium]|nr:ATP-binding protein [Egibacteraceae bacterium]
MLLRLELQLPRDVRYVGVARNVAESLFRELGCPEDVSADIQLALTEACANAVRHAVDTEEYSVVLRIDQDCCEIEVVDLGPGFGTRDPRTDRAVGPEVESGRGLLLMRALVDDLEFRALEDGTSVRLRKFWHGLALSPGQKVAAR